MSSEGKDKIGRGQFLLLQNAPTVLNIGSVWNKNHSPHPLWAGQALKRDKVRVEVDKRVVAFLCFFLAQLRDWIGRVVSVGGRMERYRDGFSLSEIKRGSTGAHIFSCPITTQGSLLTVRGERGPCPCPDSNLLVWTSHDDLFTHSTIYSFVHSFSFISPLSIPSCAMLVQENDTNPSTMTLDLNGEWQLRDKESTVTVSAVVPGIFCPSLQSVHLTPNACHLIHFLSCLPFHVRKVKCTLISSKPAFSRMSIMEQTT